MDNPLLEMMAEYGSQDITGPDDINRRSRLLYILREVSHDHRYNLDTRLACMAQLLDDNRELWCRA